MIDVMSQRPVPYDGVYRLPSRPLRTGPEIARYIVVPPASHPKGIVLLFAPRPKPAKPTPLQT